MPHRITGILIAHHETHQIDVSIRADAVANAIEREIGSFWQDIRRLLSNKTDILVAHQSTRRIFHQLPQRIANRLQQGLAKIAGWSGRRTGHIMRRSLPTDYLRAAALRKISHAHIQTIRRTSVLADSVFAWSGHRNPPRSALREDTSTEQPGIIGLAVRALGLEPTDYASPLREPARDEMTEDQKRQIFERLLFPPPAEEWVQQVLGVTLQGQSWYQSLTGALRAAEFGPDRLAGIIASGYAAGKGQGEIAEDVKPWVDGVKWRAARVARTYGLAVAGEAQREMHKQVDDLTIGWMVRATLDERTRPKHRLRNGTVYYKEPKQGQPGLDAMPHPPTEADGSLAWNCRCFIVPVLAPPSWVHDESKMEVFRNGAHQVIPDPAVYAEWFSRASERQRRIAVGTRRYDQVAISAPGTTQGQGPAWSHFVDPRSGDLLALKRLKSESPAQRANRMAEVERMIQERAADIRHLATFGFLPERAQVGVMTGAARRG